MSTGTEEPHCNFCGMPRSRTGPLLDGGPKDHKVAICADCIARGKSHLEERLRRKRGDEAKAFWIPEPLEIFNHLEKFVIGQERAKRTLAVSIANHYARLHDKKVREGGGSGATMDPEIADVVIGKSNVLLIGPTGSGKTLLAKHLAEYVNVPFAIGDATTLTEAGYVGEDVENLLQKLIHQADWDIEKAERGIIYIDEIDKLHKTGHNVSITRDVSGEGVQQALLMMIEGCICNVPPGGGRKHPESHFIQVDTSNILFICGGSFDGLEDIIAHRLGKRRIGFGHGRADGDHETARDDLLRQVEQGDLERFGLIPELIGRLPVLTPLDDLSLEDLVNVLTRPQDALLKQFRKLFAYGGVKLTFTDEAVREIARKAQARNTGARALRSVVEGIMTDLRFSMPAPHKGEVVITPEIVRGEKPVRVEPPIRFRRTRSPSPGERP